MVLFFRLPLSLTNECKAKVGWGMPKREGIYLQSIYSSLSLTEIVCLTKVGEGVGSKGYPRYTNF